MDPSAETTLDEDQTELSEPNLLRWLETTTANDKQTSNTKRKSIDLDLKRRRNREWMRKARIQQRSQFEAMRAQVAGLEHELAQLRQRQHQHQHQPQADQTDHTTSELTAIERRHANLLAIAQQLREEKNWLREELVRRERTVSSIAQLMDEMRVSCATIPRSFSSVIKKRPRSEVTESLSACFRPIPIPSVYALIRQSYQEISELMQWADTFEPMGSVLGWVNKRLVVDNHVDFMLSKTFYHVQADDVAHRAWCTYLNPDLVRLVEPSIQSMKLLQKINDDTYIFARNLLLPHTDTIFCTIFLMFRMETPEGYILGTRTIPQSTICAENPSDFLLHALSQSDKPMQLVYTDLSYAMTFTRLHAIDPTTGSIDECGCHVQFAGRMGNGTLVYANTMAMNILLMILRWENYHIGPLYTLTTD